MHWVYYLPVFMFKIPTRSTRIAKYAENFIHPRFASVTLCYLSYSFVTTTFKRIQRLHSRVKQLQKTFLNRLQALILMVTIETMMMVVVVVMVDV